MDIETLDQENRQMHARMDRLQMERNDMMVALLNINQTNRDKHGTPAKQLARCKDIAMNMLRKIQP